MREMLVLQPEALVVLVTQTPEQPREGIVLALALALIPSGRAQKVAAGNRIDRLHLLKSDHRRKVIAPRFNLRRGRQNRDRARRARRLMAAGRQPRESLIGLEEKRAELPLLRIKFGGEIADMGRLDFARLDFAICQRVGD